MRDEVRGAKRAGPVGAKEGLEIRGRSPLRAAHAGVLVPTRTHPVPRLRRNLHDEVHAPGYERDAVRGPRDLRRALRLYWRHGQAGVRAGRCGVAARARVRAPRARDAAGRRSARVRDRRSRVAMSPSSIPRRRGSWLGSGHCLDRGASRSVARRHRSRRAYRARASDSLVDGVGRRVRASRRWASARRVTPRCIHGSVAYVTDSAARARSSPSTSGAESWSPAHARAGPCPACDDQRRTATRSGPLSDRTAEQLAVLDVQRPAATAAQADDLAALPRARRRRLAPNGEHVWVTAGDS